MAEGGERVKKRKEEREQMREGKKGGTERTQSRKTSL